MPSTLRFPMIAATPLLFAAATAPLSCAYDAQVAEELDAASTTQAITATSSFLTLSLSNRASWQSRNGRRVAVIQGTSNRDLVGILGWVPDDAFGRVTMITPRRFEIVLDGGHELNTILSGSPLYLRASPASSPSDFLHARFRLAPVFEHFHGTSKLWITSEIRPVYVPGDNDTHLRYRGNVSTTVHVHSLNVFANDAANPEVHRTDDRHFAFDWRYESLALASDPPSDPVYFSAQTTSGAMLAKRARLSLSVTDLKVTRDDPWEAWPPISCSPSTYECIQQASTDPLAVSECGDYREVAVCMSADACSTYGTVPLSFASLDLDDELGPALRSYNEACGTGSSWCAASALGYTVPLCAEPAPTIHDVVAFLQEQDQEMLSDGAYVGRDELATSPFFNTGYSSGGPGLLLALDVIAGGGEIQAYRAMSEVPCHNCHDFQDDVVLFYPKTGVVIRLTGHHGYDY